MHRKQFFGSDSGRGGYARQIAGVAGDRFLDEPFETFRCHLRRVEPVEGRVLVVKELDHFRLSRESHGPVHEGPLPDRQRPQHDDVRMTGIRGNTAECLRHRLAVASKNLAEISVAEQQSARQALRRIVLPADQDDLLEFIGDIELLIRDPVVAVINEALQVHTGLSFETFSIAITLKSGLERLPQRNIGGRAGQRQRSGRCPG